MWLIWSTEVIREMQMVVPNIKMASFSMRTILNPRWFRSSITPWKKSVDSRDRMEEWGPFLMAWRMVVRDHYDPISNGNLLAT